MEFRQIHIEETGSTNQWLRDHDADDDVCVVADFQTAGRGCGTNTWESERGKNLTFSLLLHPVMMPARQQFVISKAVSVALCKVLSRYAAGFSIKWPNDIYWNDRKIAGILIENRLQGALVKDSIVGIGLNVNQSVFLSDAPNPVSLCQITGCDIDREALLCEILKQLDLTTLPDCYASLLYRRQGFHAYSDAEGKFEAELTEVEPDGRLALRTRDGHVRRYAFKEVRFC